LTKKKKKSKAEIEDLALRKAAKAVITKVTSEVLQQPPRPKPGKKAGPNPQKISEAQLVFPAGVVGKLLPDADLIPEAYWNRGSNWGKLFTALWVGTPHIDRLPKIWEMRRGHALEQLAEAGTPPPSFYMKDGIDGETAYRHLMACLKSYEPSHQHKEAGCKYLMDLWFEKVVWDGYVFTAEGVEKKKEATD